MATSPRFSLRGYDIRIALANNKDTIKSILAMGTTAAGALTALNGFDWKTLAFAFAGALGILVTKVLADAVDYFFTEVQLPDKPTP